MADGSLVTVAESWTVGRYLTSTLESHEQLHFAVLQRKGVQVSLCMVYTLARENWGHSYDS